ncbi:MAG: iron ABC transporter substrate-binding protein [Peptostreptococcaceae bacterium]|nr:iron ABC transporter substrate-binding protein [Peptostreptococcaceae bacterium]
MKTKISIAIITVIALLSLCGCSKETVVDNNTITDSLAREVLIPKEAETFVCIGPGCLRLYCYVGDVSKLVGIENKDKNVIGRPYLMANPELMDLTIIGTGGPNNSPDAEKLLVADPDVIFTTYNSDVASVDELQEKTGIPVVALSYGVTSVFDPEVDKSIEIIGAITGNEKRSKEVIAYFDELKADLQSRTENIADSDKPSVYFGAQSMRGVHGIESTSGNFALFNAIGARNVVDEAGISQYIILDKEALLIMDPEVIFIDAYGFSQVKKDYNINPSYYEGLKAFKNDKVYMLLPYNYYSTNIEIALADAYYMGSVLYPEEFSDVDLIKKFDEITQMLLGANLYDEVAVDFYGGLQQIKFGK